MSVNFEMWNRFAKNQINILHVSDQNLTKAFINSSTSTKAMDIRGSSEKQYHHNWIINHTKKNKAKSYSHLLILPYRIYYFTTYSKICNKTPASCNFLLSTLHFSSETPLFSRTFNSNELKLDSDIYNPKSFYCDTLFGQRTVFSCSCVALCVHSERWFALSDVYFPFTYLRVWSFLATCLILISAMYIL